MNKGAYSINQPYNWKGRNTEFGEILGLKTERYEYKVLFTAFSERLKNHVIQFFKHGSDIAKMVENYKDPTDEIKALLPKNPISFSTTKVKKEGQASGTAVDQDDDDIYKSADVQQMIVKELVKNHITRFEQDETLRSYLGTTNNGSSRSVERRRRLHRKRFTI